jgi:TRAP-type C4-dicarboxylate transport system substrate-binding protein
MSSRLAILVGAAAMLTVGAGSQSAYAQERLLFTSMSPGGSDNSKMYNAWAEKVNESAGGTIKLVVRDGTTIANFGNIIDRTKNDVVQVGWSITAILGGQFPLSDVVQLPFDVKDNAACSVAMWRLYKTGLLDDEYKDMVPLYFNCFTTQYVHFKKEPKSLTSFAGLKVRINGKIASDVFTKLGATVISMESGAMYEALQKNNVDAIQTSWGAFVPYKLVEVTGYHFEIPTGTTPGVTFMWKSRFDKLPAAAKEALRKHGGEARSREIGAYFDGQAAKARAQSAAAGHPIMVPTAEQRAKWDEATKPVVEEWIKSRGEKGKKVVDLFPKFYAEALRGK